MRINFIYILLFSVMVTACTGWGGGKGNTPTMEYMAEMMDSPADKAFEVPMRPPVPGTVPIGFDPYPYSKEQGEEAAQQLTNPLRMSRENLELGRRTYNTYCMVCHGPTGKGDGSIIPKFPQPPTLHSKKVREWPDGRLFHIMTRGQNLMPSYANQVSHEERWAVALYLRALQRAVNPSEADVRAYDEAKKAGWYPKD